MNLSSDKPDKLDLRILNELRLDGRIANADLAARVGLSESACLRRVRTRRRQADSDKPTRAARSALAMRPSRRSSLRIRRSSLSGLSDDRFMRVTTTYSQDIAYSSIVHLLSASPCEPAWRILMA